MQTKHDEPNTLMVETIKLLKDDKRSLICLHDTTGIPYHWLTKLSAGHLSNPSVNRIQFLYELLSDKKLSL